MEKDTTKGTLERLKEALKENRRIILREVAIWAIVMLLLSVF